MIAGWGGRSLKCFLAEGEQALDVYHMLKGIKSAHLPDQAETQPCQSVRSFIGHRKGIGIDNR